MGRRCSRAGRALKLRIAAPPVEGKANKAVVLFLSAWLDIPRSSISLLRGESSRLKVVELPDGCEGKLARLLSAEDVSGALGKPGGRQAFSLCVEGLHLARSITRQTSSMS